MSNDATAKATESNSQEKSVEDVLNAGKGPSELVLDADSRAAAQDTTKDAQKDADKDDEVGTELHDTQRVQPTPETAANLSDPTEVERFIAQVSADVASNPSQLTAVKAVFDTSGTAGRTDATSLVANAAVFTHPARLVQHAESKLAAEGNDPKDRLVAALTEVLNK